MLPYELVFCGLKKNIQPIQTETIFTRDMNPKMLNFHVLKVYALKLERFLKHQIILTLRHQLMV